MRLNINEVKNKKASIDNLATNHSLNAKINQVKCEIPSITNLAETAALTAVDNKIPNVNKLVKKSDYNTNISEIENKITTDHDKYITSQEFNKLTSEHFIAKLVQANLESKSNITNIIKRDRF